MVEIKLLRFMSEHFQFGCKTNLRVETIQV